MIPQNPCPTSVGLEPVRPRSADCVRVTWAKLMRLSVDHNLDLPFQEVSELLTNMGVCGVLVVLGKLANHDLDLVLARRSAEPVVGHLGIWDVNARAVLTTQNGSGRRLSVRKRASRRCDAVNDGRTLGQDVRNRYA